MKKRKYRLTTFGEVLILSLITIVIFRVSIKLLSIQDRHEYNKAVGRCGKDNIVEKYTNQGDIYYICKVEK